MKLIKLMFYKVIESIFKQLFRQLRRLNVVFHQLKFTIAMIE